MGRPTTDLCLTTLSRLLQSLNHRTVTGLSEAEAAARVAREGPNELPSAKARSVFAIALEVMLEPMFLLLMACGGIYLLLGDLQGAAVLLGFVAVVMGITFYQERKTARALDALRDLSSPRALVIRGGQQRRIAGREVVRGDILALAEGDRVPADAIVLWSVNLSVDESLLTGESVPIRKAPDDPESELVYSGSLVVYGTGVAEALATGAKTELGKIGKLIEAVHPEQTRLQEQTRRLVNGLAAAGLCLCLAVVLVYGLARQEWLNGILAGLALAMAMLPEEFPVVLTVFLALGALRISRNRVLTRRAAAIETLGAATVLCVDKTGTLTLNRMMVSKIFAEVPYEVAAHRKEPLPEEF